MENKDKNTFLDLVSDEAKEFGASADWFNSMHAPNLSELCRFGQKAIIEFIDAVRDECEDLDDIDDALDQFKTHYFNLYKYLQNEHFDRLAEMVIFGYIALGDVEFIIERNK